MPKTYPEPVVGGFILNEQKQILLVRSPKWQQGKIWSVPGGHIEWGESIEAAVKREVKEEVGLTITLDNIFYIQDAIFSKDFHQKRHFVFIECLCRAKAPINLQLDHTEISVAEWFTLKDALTVPLNIYTKKALLILHD